MSGSATRDVFIHPAGQDDNLGDSALRAGLLRALGRDGIRMHVHLEGQSSDYHAGIPLADGDVFYGSRAEWLRATRRAERPVLVLNAGEINPKADTPFPHPGRVSEMQGIVQRGGSVIAAGLGVKSPTVASTVEFDPLLRGASVMSWRDDGSRDAVGFGDVAPDWAFALGSDSSSWPAASARDVLAVTLRYDRPYPDDAWLAAVSRIAIDLSLRIVTVAQVARDAPRAVQLADRLRGEYVVPPSMRHDDLDAYVRRVYSGSLAVVSDRAHALIMGATEGAFPLGTAVDPQKISRLLATAGIGALTGHHDGFEERTARLRDELPGLSAAVDGARSRLTSLSERMLAVIGAD